VGHIFFPDHLITVNVTQQGSGALRFVPVTPCRIADTRNDGFGPLPANGTRTFAVSTPICFVPPNAQAYAVNVTAIPKASLGFLTVWPGGQDRPFTSLLNSPKGLTTANGALLPAGVGNTLNVFSTGPTDVVVDLEGYFVPASVPTALSFYPVTPCRILDTRLNASLAGFVPLVQPVAGTCGVPATAKAFALNFTSVPKTVLSYFTAYPGGADPFVSVMNSEDGRVLANNAIVAAGTNGSIVMYGSQATDIVVDVNGYFAAPGDPGALDFYPVVPCRVADTRIGGGIPQPNQTRTFDVVGSGCGAPAGARAYAMNITVVPLGGLPFLSVFPSDGAWPLVSTLNSFDGLVLANGAIVPAAAANGNISVYTYTAVGSNVVLDLMGYFAP